MQIWFSCQNLSHVISSFWHCWKKWNLARMSHVVYPSNPGKFCFSTKVLKYLDTYCIRSSCKIRSTQIRLYSLILTMATIVQKISIKLIQCKGSNEHIVIVEKTFYRLKITTTQRYTLHQNKKTHGRGETCASNSHTIFIWLK